MEENGPGDRFRNMSGEPPLEPGTPPDHSNAVITDGRTNEWTASSWLQVGLGYSFSP